MALNKSVLESLDSPRLRPLQMKGLVGLTAGQLRKQVEAEKQEISQLRGQLRTEMAAALGNTNFDNSVSVMTQGIGVGVGLSERQELVRELQELRREKMEIVEQIKAVRENPAGVANALEKSLKMAIRLEKKIEKLKKKKERERRKKEREEERKRKIEEKKDKIWNRKNLRKGTKSGERAHDRFQRFFNNEKIDEADKDRMRRMLNDVVFYESDEVFQILSLMESRAFESIDEAEEFLIDYYHIQKGQSAVLESFRRNGKVVNFDDAAENVEKIAEDLKMNTGLGLRF